MEGVSEVRKKTKQRPRKLCAFQVRRKAPPPSCVSSFVIRISSLISEVVLTPPHSVGNSANREGWLIQLGRSRASQAESSAAASVRLRGSNFSHFDPFHRLQF